MASRKCHELSFKAANHVAVSAREAFDGGLDSEVLLQDLVVGTHGSLGDLIRLCGHDLLLHCKILLSSMFYCMQNGCGWRLTGGGR